MKKAITIIAAGLALAGPSALISAPDLKGTRSTLEQWVEIKTLISEESSDWKVEKATLDESIELLESEIEGLKEAIEAKEEDATAAQEKRQELTAKEEELKAASSVIKQVISDLEEQILDLVSYFPPSLQEKIEIITVRIPKDEEAARKVFLSQRVQNLVGILTEAEKFNDQITVATSMQSIGGNNVQVRTIYLGLSRAYYVDGTKSEAGYLVPAKGEWKKEQDNSLAEAIATAIAVIDGEDVAQFINLPMAVN
ncbi:DUF3450 domain-containing protein [Puniceicoccaceae bacterium K14]|nr:DUF3450 domain-containing protein [Puniceicoccaceae bacterium K14]